MEDLTGKELGPYRVVASLGEGGMAAVYKAYQPAMERYVALKILPRRFASDPQFVGRFKQEARVVAKLQHPHILPVFDFGESDGYTYLVMPILQNGTLAKLLQGRPLSLAYIRAYITQIGDALDYAHSHGLLHRDVKPSNVLLDEGGNSLLSDFGLAKITEANENLTTSGVIMGTPAYMSPEQGMGDKVDRRSDIYSLGIILYEMATGRVPFKAETPIAVVFKHVQDPLPLPRSINPELPEAVEQVILKALAKEPQDRYQTAGEMTQAIRAAIPEPTVPIDQIPTVGPVSTADKHKTPSLEKKSQRLDVRRPKWIWAVGGLTLAALSVGALWIISRGTFVGGSGVVATTTSLPTATMTSSPIAETPSPAGNEALITVARDTLNDVQTGYTTTFDALPNDWTFDSPQAGNVTDGTLRLLSQPSADSGITWSHNLSDGEAIFLRFKYVGDSQKDDIFSFYLAEAGVDWNTAQVFYLHGHANASAAIKRGSAEEDHPLEGNLTLEPDTWYNLMMAISPKADLQIIIWDPSDPTHRIRYVDLTGQPDWLDKSWTFGADAFAGSADVYIDDFTEIGFSSFK